MSRSPRPLSMSPLLASLLALAAQAQEAPAPQPPSGAQARPKPQVIEIDGAKISDVDQRRRSTASKIIVGREEIEKFGDSSLGDVLKRLPGVTLDGRAGRGGNIRMRGLGNGYTQILLDGERVQGGLSLDSIDPEQVERIEVLRAPTAETGARAIAGTINIITREGFRKRLNDLKIGLSTEAGYGGANVSWAREDKLTEDINYNITLSGNGSSRRDQSVVRTTSTTLDQGEDFESLGHRQSLHVNGRLQWKLDGGDTLMLMPMFTANTGRSTQDSQLDLYTFAVDAEHPGYTTSRTASDSRSSLARLNGQYRHNLAAGGRLELQGGVGRSTNDSDSQRLEFDRTGSLCQAPTGPGTLCRTLDTDSHSTETNGHLNAKFTRLLEGDHSLVAGLETEGGHRNDQGTTLQNGSPLPGTTDNVFSAATYRAALYAQDEWNLSPNWAAHAGLRWEGIDTQGTEDTGEQHTNRSSVWTPLVHAVWKPDPKGPDQMRLSLTRSYRSPVLSDLLARHNVSQVYPVSGANTPTSPDRAGNPDLKPELATGVDLAWEHYLPDTGLLSINFFHRRIHDLMRTVTELDTVSWSPVQRWVSRPQNIGSATTQGIELEARMRLSSVWDGAPALDVRANASLFRSTVDGVPGPDNRLNQQPSGTANLGADYRLPGTPLTLGGNLNWTPGYTTRLSDNQWVIQGRKQVLDAYAQWQLSPTARLRLTASNLTAEDALSTNVSYGQTAATDAQTYLNVRLQLELKL